MNKTWLLLSSFFLLIVVTSSNAQELDLIVATNGDSIACRIDSITETLILFEMRSQGRWRHTQIELSKVSHYEKDIIDKDKYVFKPGTTIIESEYTFQLPKNSVYVGIMTLNYARTIHRNLIGLTIAGGVTYIDNPGILVEQTLLVGRRSHFFEPGIMFWYGFSSNSSYEDNSDNSGMSIRIGYRFQAEGGFLFRVAPVICFFDETVVLLPALSIGYSF